MLHTRFYRLALAVLGATLIACVLGRLTVPQPRQAPGCPYGQACPYCKGRMAFDAGQDITENPLPNLDDDDPLQPRQRWNAGWLDGQRTLPALSD